MGDMCVTAGLDFLILRKCSYDDNIFKEIKNLMLKPLTWLFPIKLGNLIIWSKSQAMITYEMYKKTNHAIID
jgi:hypothetical protein